MESLAVKYRPSSFEETVGQESTIKILSRMIETRTFKNALLFCGSSGCGKTTVARILAKAINNNLGSPIEIDGASNNGVDNVRNIIQEASERSVDSEYKVYIIDEAHALSNAAWQAFLKCIEEPPRYTIFIFCTTDPQKIPATILNRVMRFNFTRIRSDLIKNRLLYICKQEGFTNYEESCDYISRICNGGMRDGIALLEKCAGYSTDISIDNVLACVGNFSYSMFFNLVNSIIDGNETNVIKLVSDFYDMGSDFKLLIDQFLSFCLDVYKYSIFTSCEMTKIPASMEEDLKSATNFASPGKTYGYIVNKLLELKNYLKDDTNPKATVEVCLLSLARWEA